MRLILSISFILSLSSCALVSEKSCVEADWYDKGLYDALDGFKPMKSNYFIRQCEKEFDISFDKAAYLSGYKKGIASNCTFKSARRYGRSRKSHTFNECPLDVRHLVIEEFYKTRVKTLKNTKKQSKEQSMKVLSLVNRFEIEIKHNKNYDDELDSKIKSLKSSIKRELNLKYGEHSF